VDGGFCGVCFDEVRRNASCQLWGAPYAARIDWVLGRGQQLVEVCRLVDTLLVDLDVVYAPRLSNDRLLLGLKGSLNEYELDLLSDDAKIISHFR